jgi:hypothetical protein
VTAKVDILPLMTKAVGTQIIASTVAFYSHKVHSVHEIILECTKRAILYKIYAKFVLLCI